MRQAGIVVAALGLAGAGLLAGAAAPDGPRGLVYRDVTEAVGLAPVLADSLNHAVAWGDFDGDGRLDLFLGNFCDRSGPAGLKTNLLLRQTGEGVFIRVPMGPVETRGRTSGAVFVDLDNDGDLDLVVSNNTHPGSSDVRAKNEPSALYRNDGGRFVDVSKSSGACPADGAFGRDVGVLDFDGNGLLDLLVVEDKVFRPKGHTRLYRNLGNLRFEDATASAGLPEDLDGFGVAVGDASGDGLPDIFLCGPNRLFLGAPGGKFREAEALRPVFDLRASDAEEYLCGAVFGDVDNDGDLDLVAGTHFVPSRIRLYLNEGVRDGVPQLRDVTQAVGLPALPNKAATCAVEDFDNDGVADLYWSVWFAEGAAREPFVCRGLGVRDGLPRFAVPSLDGLDQSLVRKNAVPAGRRGMVYYVDGPPVDYDGDGDLDFFAGAWPEEGSRLLRNDSPPQGNWLEVRVVGTRMNRMGLGARVQALADGKLVGLREVSVCGGYSGTRPALVHLGLGEHERVDLEVTLPGRAAPVTLTDVRANQVLTVTEPRD